MRHRATLSAAVSALLLAVAAPALAQTPPAPQPPGPAVANAFTYQDMISANRLGDPQVSPDGKTVLYSLTTTDVVANKRASTIWSLPLGGEATQLALPAGANTVRFAPDGSILFLAAVDGISQVWRAAADGSGARAITDLPLDVNAFRISPDGTKLAVSLAVYPDAADLAASVARKADVAARASTGQVYERLFVRHWDTWTDHTQTHLFVGSLGEDGAAGGDLVWITKGFDGDTPSKPFGDESDFVFTPGSDGVVFSAREAGKSEAWSTNFDLYQTDLTGSGRFTNLTDDNDAWDAGPVFSPDGRTLAYRAMARPGFEADRYQIRLRDMATGQVRDIAANWDRSADTLQWSKDGTKLYTTAGDVGQTRLFSVDTRNGTVVPVTGPGHVSAFVQAEGGFVFAQDTLRTPSDLWFKTFAGRDAPRRLTDVNPAFADKVFGEAEQFSFAGWNGETVHGYVIKPAGYVEGRKYPVAFLIHGGPQGSFGDSWSYRWNPSTYAGAGFAVVMIDFHGSTGYGQAFTDAISGDWGDKPLVDLQKGWAAAQQKYPFLDGDRACALGASYGGYMVNWIAGQWNEAWKCLVNHNGVFDTRSMGLVTEELWFTEWEFGGTVASNPEAYEKYNPARHIDKWKVPMLVVAGQNDFRVPVDQSLSSFTALQRAGIESKLLYFPDENHWVLKPHNSILWHDTVNAWLKKHIGQ